MLPDEPLAREGKEMGWSRFDSHSEPALNPDGFGSNDERLCCIRNQFAHARKGSLFLLVLRTLRRYWVGSTLEPRGSVLATRAFVGVVAKREKFARVSEDGILLQTDCFREISLDGFPPGDAAVDGSLYLPAANFWHTPLRTPFKPPSGSQNMNRMRMDPVRAISFYAGSASVENAVFAEADLMGRDALVPLYLKAVRRFRLRQKTARMRAAHSKLSEKIFSDLLAAHFGAQNEARSKKLRDAVEQARAIGLDSFRSVLCVQGIHIVPSQVLGLYPE